MLFQDLRGAGEHSAAERIASHFWELPANQVNCQNMPFASNGLVLSAPFLCSLGCTKPGSACGSQPQERFHVELEAEIQDELRNKLLRAQPPEAVFGLHTALGVEAEQIAKKKSFPCMPVGLDYFSMSSPKMADVGRSPATELFEVSSTLVHQVRLPDLGLIGVMPHSLLCPRKLQVPVDGRTWEWAVAPRNRVIVTNEEARLIAQATTETDGNKLLEVCPNSALQRALRRVLSGNLTQRRGESTAMILSAFSGGKQQTTGGAIAWTPVQIACALASLSRCGLPASTNNVSAP